MSGTDTLAVIVGSVRRDRVGPAVARWFTDGEVAGQPIGFVAHGGLRPPERAAHAAATLLRRLAWWTRALRPARAACPYDG
jgi:hypothetical protein